MAPEESQEGAGGHEGEAPGQEAEQADGHRAAVETGDGQQLSCEVDDEGRGQAQGEQDQGETEGGFHLELPLESYVSLL